MLSMGSFHSSQNSLSVFLIHMFYLVWFCGESREERHADFFLSEFHKWVLAVVHFAVKGVGKFEVVGGRVEDEWGVMGPWEYGRFQVRNEANLNGLSPISVGGTDLTDSHKPSYHITISKIIHQASGSLCLLRYVSFPPPSLSSKYL